MSIVETVRLDPRFRLRAPLRCDGVGKLDWGEDTISRERVAVRWLPLKANGEAAVIACAELPHHPALPKILQLGQVDEQAFLIMEFPDGELLSSRVADGEWLDAPGVLLVAVQVAQALSALHQHGFVHGELGADSVLLVPGDRILWWDVPLVLADRMTDRREDSRPARQLVKTAAYLAPECARGAPATEASDVYSLGATLCRASGALPPVSASTLGILHEVASGTWRPTVTRVWHARWAAVVRQMLDPDPRQRPPAQEVATLFTSFASILTLVPKFGVTATGAPTQGEVGSGEEAESGDPEDKPQPNAEPPGVGVAKSEGKEPEGLR